MEGIADLVSASLARHGFTAQVDHRRLQWSQWFRCESSFSVLLVPSKPGLFEFAEEQAAEKPRFVSGHRLGDAVPAAGSGTPSGAEAVPLVLFRISQTEDLGMALGRLLLPIAPECGAGALAHESYDRLSTKPCYVRYAIIEDEDQRHASYRALQDWMATLAAGSVTEVTNELAIHNFVANEEADGNGKSAA